MSHPQPCTDRVALDLWHPVCAVGELVAGRTESSLLLGETIDYGTDTGGPFVTRSGHDEQLPVQERYGYLWTCLGTPAPMFDIPEFDEPDRRSLNAGSIMVATSAPRAVENFLDLGHFPYVHTDLLGAEPRTEVEEYNVEIVDGEIWATQCRFYQPKAAANATEGQMTEYTYRVPAPYCVLLYKSCAIDPSRRDVIGLFLQPMTEERSRAHNFLCMIDVDSTDTGLRRFQQLIFAQDKPILENQYPKRLPLDPRAETPIRADQSAIVYRRWLSEMGLGYAVVPAA